MTPRLVELGLVPYVPTWQRMRAWTARRDAATRDELWLLEHEPVYTLGLAGRREHVLAPGPIPVVTTDRGGQVTYHGPGQAVVYVLVDLRRRGLGVRRLVRLIEQSVIDLLAVAGIDAARREGAPGVYVGGAKVASLGLRVRGGCSYHGVALNVDLDLTPFAGIDPCGMVGQPVTSVARLGLAGDAMQWGRRLGAGLAAAIAAAPADRRLQPG